MAPIQQFITDPELSPRLRVAHPQARESEQSTKSTTVTQHTIDVPNEVLKFAPKKLRRIQTGEDQTDQLKSEIKYWQDRASEAEARVRHIEKLIQQIAADHVPRFKKSLPAA